MVSFFKKINIFKNFAKRVPSQPHQETYTEIISEIIEKPAPIEAASAAIPVESLLEKELGVALESDFINLEPNYSKEMPVAVIPTVTCAPTPTMKLKVVELKAKPIVEEPQPAQKTIIESVEVITEQTIVPHGVAIVEETKETVVRVTKKSPSTRHRKLKTSRGKTGKGRATKKKGVRIRKTTKSRATKASHRRKITKHHHHKKKKTPPEARGFGF